LPAGREAGSDGPEYDEVLVIAAAHEATPAQVRLAWALHRGPHVLVIPGTGTPDHLVDNVSAGALRLTAEDVRRLDALHRRVG
jgi:pyridoxine 4-dehydrogenase